MASVARKSLALSLVVAAVSVPLPPGAAGSSTSFNITNSCAHTVWPAISSGASSASAAPDTTGFELAPGQWEIVAVPSGWSGRVWARTLCSSSTTNSSSGNRFRCLTGDCGSGDKQDCGGPVTVAEFTLDGSGGMDLYDVSLVDGFNLPVMVAPQQVGEDDPAAGGSCAPTGCMVDMNVVVGACPPELRVVTSGSGTGGATVGCKSASQAFGSPQYCCTGEYGNPNTCKPSAYSELFKKACPLTLTYAYDDGAGAIFTCGGGGDTTYAIIFCPRTASGKLSSSPKSQAPPPGTGNLPHIIDGTTPMPCTIGGSQDGGAATPPWRVVLAGAALGLVTAALGLLAQFFGALKLCFKRAVAAGTGG